MTHSNSEFFITEFGAHSKIMYGIFWGGNHELQNMNFNYKIRCDFQN